jgi:hypothetical protein
MKAHVLVGALLVSSPLLSQAPTIRLQPSTARLAIEFSDLNAIRELRDGRVLLFDRKESQLFLADLASGATTKIGRTGQGPGEYEIIVALVPLGGDSTLASDFSRWLILDGAKIVATLPPDTPAIRAVSLAPMGADRSGRVLTRRFGRGLAGRAQTSPDSLVVALVDRATGRSDSVAALRIGVRRTQARPAAGPDGKMTAVRIGRVPLNPQEEALLFADGWLAIARLDPYRVDWRSPDGQWIRGAPLPFRPVSMSDRERDAYIANHSWARNATDWPEIAPPFDSSPLLSSPDGRLVIGRLPSADDPGMRYDLVDRRGVSTGQLLLAANERILGFGRAAVFVVVTDDDGIQRLQRHPWP